MTTTCKLCGEQGLTWANRTGGWRLMGEAGLHRCPKLLAVTKQIQERQKTGAFLHWIQKTRYKKQAWLQEPQPTDADTPEGFYCFEQEVRSTLTERAIAHGYVFTEDKR